MENLSKIKVTVKGEALNELEDCQLADVTGGAIWVSDGYCGTPFPWPPRPMQVAGPSIYVNPAPLAAGLTLTQQYGMG